MIAFVFQKGLGSYVTMLVSIIMFLACKPEPVAEQKFVGLPQETKGDFHGNVLIKRVHESSWKIFYGFSDNKRCGGQFTDTNIQDLKDKVMESIEVWLSPLSAKDGIITRENITLEERVTISAGQNIATDDTVEKEETDDSMEKTFDIEDEEPHLSIVFYCIKGRSYARVRENNPEIHMLQEWPRRYTAILEYSSTTIHHEMGHAFGLGDTYVDETKLTDKGEHDKCWKKRLNYSIGGHKFVAGEQPLSVMNLQNHPGIAQKVESNNQNVKTNKLKLSVDDIAGIRWLYRYYSAKGNNTVTACDCPYEYVYEIESRGCKPKYPLIFAVKQGVGYIDFQLFKKYVSQKDEFGNTALHHAAAMKHSYEQIKNLGVDPAITNDLGHTAQNILAAKNPSTLLHSDAAFIAAQEQHRLEIAKSCKALELHLPAKDGEIEKVKNLLEEGVNVNALDFRGYTALHYAAINLRYEITKLLLAHSDIDPLVQNNQGYTALDLLNDEPYSNEDFRACVDKPYDPNDFESSPNMQYDFMRRDLPVTRPSPCSSPETLYDFFSFNAGPENYAANLATLKADEKIRTRWCDIIKLFRMHSKQ